MSGAAWSLVQHADPAGGRPRLGLMLDGVVHAPPPALADLSVMEVLEAWGEHGALLRSLDGRRGARRRGGGRREGWWRR